MSKMLIPAHVKHRYALVSPSGKFRRFRIRRRIEGEPLRSISDERLDAINNEYLALRIGMPEARMRVEKLIEDLYREQGVKVVGATATTANEKICAAYIKTLKRLKKPASQQARDNYLWAATRAVGELSLLTASSEKLEDAVSAAYPDQRSRRIITALNAILVYLKRTRLQKDAQTPIDVRYLPEDCLAKVVEHLPTRAWQVLVQLAFYSGLRLGELMALERQHGKQSVIVVDWQMDRHGNKRLPKNDKTRRVVPFPAGMKFFKEWVDLKHEITPEMRNLASRTVMAACKKAYPHRKTLWLTFHDLRHSYAVLAIEAGASIELVAKQLGNAGPVTERHYIGFVQSTKMEDAMLSILSGKK